MSITSARICCTMCDYETTEFYCPIYIVYRAANGIEIRRGRGGGWCYDCDEYVDIESSKSTDVAQLTNELTAASRDRKEEQETLRSLEDGFLAEFRNKAKRCAARSTVNRLDKEIVKLGELLKIVKGRNSPPRCLCCWSMHTAPIVFNESGNITQDFKHKCGGSLKLIPDNNGPAVNFRVETYVLDREGRLLEMR